MVIVKEQPLSTSVAIELVPASSVAGDNIPVSAESGPRTDVPNEIYDHKPSIAGPFPMFFWRSKPLICLSIIALFAVLRTSTTSHCNSRFVMGVPYWGNIQPEKCTAYGVRKYSAPLRNVDYRSTKTLNACQDTKVFLQNIHVKPIQCQFVGRLIVGHFMVRDDLTCKPYWGDFQDQGCVARGSLSRRVESQILDIPPEEDWLTVCSTMPAIIYGANYSKPTHCVVARKLAIWDIDDSEC